MSDIGLHCLSGSVRSTPSSNPGDGNEIDLRGRGADALVPEACGTPQRDMRSAVEQLANNLQWAFFGEEGASGRVVFSWILAGGVTGGGIVIGTMALYGGGNAGLHLLVAPVLFLAGSLAGFLHGLVLAIVGRAGSCTRWCALKRAVLATVLSVPFVGLSWLIASAIVVGTALQLEFRWSWLLVSTGGWLLGAMLCGWAAVEGWSMLRRAYRRCPRRRLGLALAALAWSASALAFLEVGVPLPMVSAQ